MNNKRKKPKGLDSGTALASMEIMKSLPSTPAQIFESITDMIRRIEVCPTCGNEKDIGFLTLRQARKLLNLTKTMKIK
jgi:hypothetical protein